MTRLEHHAQHHVQDDAKISALQKALMYASTCVLFALIALLCLLPVGCDKPSNPSTGEPATSTGNHPTEATTKGMADFTATIPQQPPLEFPDELRAEEPAVNALLTKAMQLCTSGDYEAFREIWSARETPIPEAKFRHMREAVTRITIGALERAALKRTDENGNVVPEIVYVAYARMGLDVDRLPPRAAEKYKNTAKYQNNDQDRKAENNDLAETSRPPEREAVLMLVKEFDEWRLAHAPDKMRKWLKQKVRPTTPKDNTDQSTAGETNGETNG